MLPVCPPSQGGKGVDAMADNRNSIRMFRCLIAPGRHTMFQIRRYRSARRAPKTPCAKRSEKPPPRPSRHGLLNEGFRAADFVHLHRVGRFFVFLDSLPRCRSPPLLTF